MGDRAVRQLPVLWLNRARSFPRLAALFGLALFLGAALADPVGAQVIERREGEANPMVAIFKSTVYGAGAGIVVGLAIELVASDADGEALRWGFVGGTVIGFAYGIYYVASRPKPGRALLEGGSEGWAFAVPQPVAALEASDLRSVRFERNFELDTPLVALRF